MTLTAVSERLRILVADDNLNVRKILCIFLQNAGYDVLEAANGREALEGIRLHHPDLAILDVMMPIQDGFSVCRAVKEDPDTRDIPVLMCTAKNHKEDLVSAIKGGADGYVVKPFTREIILGKIQKFLSSRKNKSSAMLLAVDRRNARRRTAGWTVSWGAGEGDDGLSAFYQGRVLDISAKGFGFEFPCCTVCTGYERGTVHPLCILSRYARRFQESDEIEFVLNVRNNVILEVRGRIAHILQNSEEGRVEKIGVCFTRISAEARRTIEEYVNEKVAV